MKEIKILNDIWQKASIIGALWASSEIVLGSFLHNLKIPFAGSILSGIAIILIISFSYIWKDKGLFWRAGLIAALMKTLSPSAVIFGPMVAIFMVGVIMDFSTRLLGRNYFGFIIGATLAVSWSFFQKLFNYIIFYGFNIVELYKSLMEYLEKILNLNFESLWLPLLILFSIYAITGFIASLIGIKTAKKIIANPVDFNSHEFIKSTEIQNKVHENSFPYSIDWLFINIGVIIAALFLINFAQYFIWMAFIVVVTIIWIIKYKRALRQLSSPKFWIFFAVITMLAAIVFTLIQEKSIYEAIMIGVEMNFRATIMILGFSVIGTELYNPIIRKKFSQSNFKNLPLAMELAAESLPFIIANLPDGKQIFQSPYKLLSKLIAYSEFRLEELNEEFSHPNHMIITGSKDSGKTTSAIEYLENSKEKIAGVITHKVFEQGNMIGYDVQLYPRNDKYEFLRIKKEEVDNNIGKFHINMNAILKVEKHLSNISRDPKIKRVIIDEVGKLELQHGGWHNSLNKLISADKKLLLVVRDSFLEDVLKLYAIEEHEVLGE